MSTKSDVSELKSCPFCARIPTQWNTKMVGYAWYQLQCDCGIRTPYYQGKDIVIKVWNKRVSETVKSQEKAMNGGIDDMLFLAKQINQRLDQDLRVINTARELTDELIKRLNRMRKQLNGNAMLAPHRHQELIP